MDFEVYNENLPEHWPHSRVSPRDTISHKEKGFQEGFRKLYREVEYRCGIDLKARKRNKPKLRMMDIIDGCGKPREVYVVACEIFHVGRAA